MAKICPLFSGSSGNSIYISSGETAILIDVGKSAKQIEISLKENNLNVNDIKAIFITHEHTDHIQGLRVFASRYNVKTYASKGTYEILKYKGIINGKFPVEIIDKNEINIDSMSIKSFSTSHDSAESLGFVVSTYDDRKIGIATDLGFVSKTVCDSLTGCDVLVFESNHDIGMLENGPYPYYLKRRILSSKGHLSNNACAKILPEFLKTGTTRFILAHLSKENNIEELAYQTSLESLERIGGKNNIDFLLSVAPKSNLKGYSVLI